MNTFLLKLLIAAAPQLPSIINEFSKTVKDAETNEDAAKKVRALLEDVGELIAIALKIDPAD